MFMSEGTEWDVKP